MSIYSRSLSLNDLHTRRRRSLASLGTVAVAAQLLTCYDVRFPEPSLILRRRGAQILTYPSAFTVRTGLAHWTPLLQARAIETQSYVVAAAQSGQHPDTQRVSYGRASIVDPWGVVVAQCSDASATKASFAVADIVRAENEMVMGGSCARKALPLTMGPYGAFCLLPCPSRRAGPRRTPLDSDRDAAVGPASV